MSNKLEQAEFKLEKNIGIQKHAGNVRKNVMSTELKIETHKKLQCFGF